MGKSSPLTASKFPQRSGFLFGKWLHSVQRSLQQLRCVRVTQSVTGCIPMRSVEIDLNPKTEQVSTEKKAGGSLLPMAVGQLQMN
ncbi:hypothetical protein BOP93_15840 [Pseudomonas orientalis]|uniref:Uncharacterized protein n=1 Tax=Pseudomonas orientalis TaxID=76758 RepID=A0A2L0RYB6_9PSED|nr:hypothetical protein BOP93_15840 [Pseudomonas orientalis]